MKKLLFILAVLSVSVPFLRAGGVKAMPGAVTKAYGLQTAAPAARQFKKYAMDNNYFSCNVPAGWRLEREKARDEEYKIYEIELLAPAENMPQAGVAAKTGAAQPDKSPTAIYVSYYAKDNADFDGYADFIERNATDALGGTKSERETYGPVKKIKFNGREASELSRAKTVYLHPESKSDESVKLKEKLYVLPARDGFYVLHLTAPETAFSRHLKIFEQVARSFKGRP